MKNREIGLIILSILLFLPIYLNNVRAQENRMEFMVNFRVSSSRIDKGYKKNAARIEELVSTLRNIKTDTTITITSVAFCGAASPEGSYEYNKQLANERLAELERIVRNEIDIPDNIVTYDDSYIPWEELAKKVRDSDITNKKEVLKILESKPELVPFYGDKKIDRRVLRLKAFRRGKVWRQIFRRYFSSMRNASVILIEYRYNVPAVPIAPEPVISDKALASTANALRHDLMRLDKVCTDGSSPHIWTRQLHLKTNAIGLGLAVANAAVELDLGKHWSFNLPVYYSAWNYFSHTTKFRTFAVQPELRYWFNRDNDGWFTGAHFGLAYYNFATGGEFRTQDHDGSSPALGGGLAVGYRMPISGNERWKMELSIGVGAYSLNHDKFRNTDNGLLVSTEKKTYIGIDQASISIAYTFDLGKKGGWK